MLTKEAIRNRMAVICRYLRFLVSHWDKAVIVLLIYCLAAGIFWSYHRHTAISEMTLRNRLVQTALGYLGCSEEDGSHLPILDRYNAQTPLPRDYTVTPTDSWCAVFGTVAAMEAGLSDIVPPECSCGRQIDLFRERNQWVETDWYLPRPGDYIFYDWDNTSSRDSTGWPDHVGIVVQTFGPVIKVIEGNKDDMVTYRYVFLDDLWIRGYGTPDFTP